MGIRYLMNLLVMIRIEPAIYHGPKFAAAAASDPEAVGAAWGWLAASEHHSVCTGNALSGVKGAAWKLSSSFVKSESCVVQICCVLDGRSMWDYACETFGAVEWSGVAGLSKRCCGCC